MIRVEQLAKELGCSTKTIYNYVNSGKIKAVKIGNKWQVSQEEIDYIKQNGLR